MKYSADIKTLKAIDHHIDALIELIDHSANPVVKRFLHDYLETHVLQIHEINLIMQAAQAGLVKNHEDTLESLNELLDETGRFGRQIFSEFFLADIAAAHLRDTEVEAVTGLASYQQASNHRRVIRYKASGLIATIKFKRFLFKKVRVVDVINLSSWGMGIRSKERLPLNTKLKVDIIFNHKVEDNIQATVVNAKLNHGYGLKFSQHHPELIEYLLESEHDIAFG